MSWRSRDVTVMIGLHGILTLESRNFAADIFRCILKCLYFDIRLTEVDQTEPGDSNLRLM